MEVVDVKVLVCENMSCSSASGRLSCVEPMSVTTGGGACAEEEREVRELLEEIEARKG